MLPRPEILQVFVTTPHLHEIATHQRTKPAISARRNEPQPSYPVTKRSLTVPHQHTHTSARRILSTFANKYANATHHPHRRRGPHARSIDATLQAISHLNNGFATPDTAGAAQRTATTSRAPDGITPRIYLQRVHVHLRVIRGTRAAAWDGCVCLVLSLCLRGFMRLWELMS